MNLLYTLLSVNTSEPIVSLKEKLLYGGEMVLIGMGTIFAVLIVLMLTLMLFKYVFAGFGTPSKKSVNNTPESVVLLPNKSSENEEIVAVIAAAIAAAENESNGLKFKVVSFRKK